MRKNRKSSDNNHTIKLTESFCRSVLDSVHLNDDCWWCMVILIVESSAQHKRFVKMFTEAAETGKRKSIFNLSYTKLIADVKRLAKSDIKSCPASQRICHYASDLLDNSQKLPTWLLARLIKYMIHRAKAENVSRLKAEMDLADDIDREFNLMQTHLQIEATNTRHKSFERSNTLVRKRGEEWKDGGFVDDSPPEGPNLYVTLTGFYHFQLIQELVQAGVPLMAILKVKNSYENIKFRRDCEPESIDSFWNSLEDALNDKSTFKDYCNFIFLNLCHRPMRDYLEDDECNMIATQVYDKVSHVAFDLFDCYRQHVQYIRHMNLFTFEDASYWPENLSCYNEKLDKVAQEQLSVPVILDALLHQVVQNVKSFDTESMEERAEDKLGEVLSEIYEHSNSACDRPVAEFIDKLYDLCWKNDLLGDHFEQDKSARSNGEECDFKKLAYIVLFEKLFGKENHADENAEETLRCQCFWNMFKMYLNMDSLKPADAKHCLNFLALERVMLKIDDTDFGRSSLEMKNNFDKHAVFTDENVTTIGQYHNCMIKLLLSAQPERKCNCLPSPKKQAHWLFTELNHFQSLNCSLFLQSFYNCLLSYDQCRVKYVKPSDCVLLIFTNTVRSFHPAEQKYSINIRTPSCLRDFVEYVVDEEVEWLDREQKKYEDEVVARMSHSLKEKDKQSTMFRYLDFLSPSSLKKDNCKTEEAGDGEKGETKKEANNRRASRMSNQKWMKKSDIDTSFLPQRKLFIADCGAEEPLDFIGYDLGNCRLQINYETKTFASPDGTRVRINNEEWLRSTKCTSINIDIVGSDLWIHNSHLQNSDTSFNFHLTSRTGTVVAFAPVYNVGRDVKKLHYQCRISEPSGLLIEPKLDHLKNVHCIVQRNVKRDEVKDEIKRKYLQNGTVIIYFVDGMIRLLFANGTIVDLKSYPRININDKTSVSEDGISLSSDKGKKNKRKVSRTSLKLNKKKISRSLNQEILSSLQNLSVEGILSNVKGLSRIENKLHYHIFEHDGRQREIVGNDIVQEFDRLLVKTVCNYEVGEEFICREDGTHILRNSNGECIVSFPDGTIITTTYEIEDELIVCDWTEEEFKLYFAHKRVIVSNNLRDDNSVAQREPSQSNLKEEMKEILAVDSFVSILLTCRVEHRNYASVEFDVNKSRCTLHMQHEMKVEITDDCYSVCMRSDAQLKVAPDFIELTKLICERCDGRFASIYKTDVPHDREMNPVIFQSTDMFGNNLKMYENGETDYMSVTSCECFKSGNKHCADYSKLKNCENVKKKCLPNPHSRNAAFRVFAMNRDFTAFEYLHQSAIQDVKRDFTLDMGSPFIHYLAPGKIDSRYQPTLSEKQLELSSCHCQSLRGMSLRSTYSIPYDWLFPFGKYGDGYQKHTFNSALKDHFKKSNEIHTSRIVKDIESSTLIRFSNTIGSCWEHAMN